MCRQNKLKITESRAPLKNLAGQESSNLVFPVFVTLLETFVIYMNTVWDML